MVGNITYRSSLVFAESATGIFLITECLWLCKVCWAPRLPTVNAEVFRILTLEKPCANHVLFYSIFKHNLNVDFSLGLMKPTAVRIVQVQWKIHLNLENVPSCLKTCFVNKFIHVYKEDNSLPIYNKHILCSWVNNRLMFEILRLLNVWNSKAIILSN